MDLEINVAETKLLQIFNKLVLFPQFSNGQ